MDLELIMTRADDVLLQELLGQDVLRILATIDPSQATPSKLRRILMEVKSKAGLLCDTHARAAIVDLLRPDELVALARLLGAATSDLCRQQVSSETFMRSQRNKQTIFGFFDVPLEVEEGAPPIPNPLSVVPQYRLFPYQRSVVKRATEILHRMPARVLLHMPTGSGKTRTAMNLIAEHLRSRENGLVVWLAYSEELCEQAAGEFEAAWGVLGNRDVPMHRYWGVYEFGTQQPDDGLAICGLAKVHARGKRDGHFIQNLAMHCDLLVFDEAHQALAPTYNSILGDITALRPECKVIGLTATPGRSWSDIAEDQALAEVFHSRKIEMEAPPGFANPLEYLIQEGYLARPSFRSLFYTGASKLTDRDLDEVANELDIPKSVLETLAADDVLNLKILAEVELLATRHHRIIVFAATTDHSDVLGAVMRSRGIDAFSITSKTEKGARQARISSFKDNAPGVKVLCNFGILTTGFDAPKTSAVVIARPTKSLVLYSQMIGRAMRGVASKGNKACEIVSIVDSRFPGFRDIVEAFSNWNDVWR